MKTFLGSLFVLLAGLPAPALADQSQATAPSLAPSGSLGTTVEAAPTPGILDSFRSGYFATYHGAPVTDPGSSYTLDHMGRQNKLTTSNLDGTADLAYLVAEDIAVGAYIPFLLVPAPGQHFVLGDVGVEFYDRKLVATDTVRLYVNFIVQGSTSDYSKSRNQSVAFKSTPYAWYQFPRSNFKVGAWTEIKDYEAVTSGKTFKLWALPYVNYALSDSFSLNLGYEMEADHFFGASTWDFTNYQTDLQPGFVWKISSRLIVNPYVQIFTGNKLMLDDTALGATLTAKLL